MQRASAILSRILSNQEEKIKLLSATQPTDLPLIRNISTNLRLPVENKLSPLKLYFSYDIRALNLYLSFSSKEPSDIDYEMKFFNP